MPGALMAPRGFFCLTYAFCSSSSSEPFLVPSSSSSSSSSAKTAPPCECVRPFSFGALSSLLALTGFEFFPSSGNHDFRILSPDFVARIIVSMVLARVAAASASASSSSFSSSEGSSNQPGYFDRPFFFLGVAFLTAIPFFFTDFVVPA